jgi:AbrB family looped-hinge helix DNA binding protein
MRMKIFNKGQVVIPSRIRHGLGISPGDYLDVSLDLPNKKIELRPYHCSEADSLAGSLSAFARRKTSPNRKQTHDALKKGLLRDS